MMRTLLCTLVIAVAIITCPVAMAGAFSATRTFDPPTYTAGDTVTVTLTVDLQTAPVLAFGIYENPPLGGVIIDPASVRAVGYDLYPRMTAGGDMELAFLEPPTMPVTITYVALISAGMSGDLEWAGWAYWRLRTPEAEVTADLPVSTLSEYVAPPVHHTADQNKDGHINLTELLRVVQFYNSFNFHCEVGTEDGYAPGLGTVGSDYSCVPHSSDYKTQDWQISLSELLRLIQFYNGGGYVTCPDGEDGFCLPSL